MEIDGDLRQKIQYLLPKYLDDIVCLHRKNLTTRRDLRCNSFLGDVVRYVAYRTSSIEISLA